MDEQYSLSKRFWICYATGFALWQSSLFLLAPYDLAISKQLHKNTTAFGQWIQDWGTTPSAIIYSIAIGILIISFKKPVSPLIKRISVIILLMVLIHPTMLNTALKLLWGRTRFINLDAAYSQYSPFYSFHPFSGDVSFPSGHVASALILTPVCFLLYKIGKIRLALALTCLTLIWGMTVAYARVIFGAHYVTDVLFSLGFSPLLAPHVVRLEKRVTAKYFPANVKLN